MNLADVKREWEACRKCRLHHGRSTVVVGGIWTHGDTAGAPVVLVIGEAPGQNEDAQGIPFVGKAGKILREEILDPAGVRLGYITNCVACRPPDNRDPNPDEISACAPRVQEIASILRPDLVVSVGRFAKAEVDAGTWGQALVDVPHVSITHPARILREGYPNKATRQKIALAAQKIRSALAKIEGALAAPGTADPFPQGPADGCTHEPVKIGSWRLPSGATRSMLACRRCATICDPLSATP